MNFHRIQIFLLFFLFYTYQCHAQGKRLFDSNDGLSNSLINQVYQDHLGFIWLATEDGLNRFDGIKFTSFTQDKKLENALKANFVTSLMEDRNKNLWVGMINGLQIYNHETEKFKEIEFYVADKRIHPYISSMLQAANGDIWITTSAYGIIQIDKNTGRPRYSSRLNKKLCSVYLKYIFEDADNILWIGSDNAGLNSFNPTTGEVKLYSESADEKHALPSNDISSICEDDKGNIYVGSIMGGLSRIEKKTGLVQRIQSSNPNEKNLPIKDLLYDSKKRLWAGTDGLGLKQLNFKKDLLESYSPSSSSFDFSKGKIHSIIEDNAGNLWLGIFQKGLYLFTETPELFNHYGYNAYGENSIGSNCITAIDGDGAELWIGTDGDGIYNINKTTQKAAHIRLKSQSMKVEGNSVLSLHNGLGDYLWIGTYFNGLVRYNKKTGEIKSYKNNPADPNSLVNDRITNIIEDKDNQLWLGTLGGGICRFDPEKEKFYNGLNLSDSLNRIIPKWVNAIFIDKDGNFWIGTYDGLVYADITNQKVKLYTESNGFLSTNLVYCIQSDNKDNIWLGSYGGLVKVDRENFTSKFYTVDDGLCCNVVCAINEDEYHQLWISTHSGLSRFNAENETFTNYYASDGLQSNEFSRNATFKTKNNELLFGGINGITEIKRDYKNYTRKVRDVMLTEFFKFDKPVKMGDKSGKHIILNKSIVMADTVSLVERDNVFSIRFTSVELANQSRITYEYKMDGFDLKWNTSNSLSRIATYTNLTHGTYTFFVRAVDKDQHSNPKKLTIIIYPPWYKTIVAKIFWFLLGGAFIYGVFLFNREKLMRKSVEKMNEMKMQFFINISHEIKTPLTLIIDPIEKLLSKKVDEDTLRLYHTMHQNATRIFRLINQLLDVRRIDKGKILIKYQNTNLYKFIKEVAQSYELLAVNKKINFKIETNNPYIQVWIDPLNFEKVILNLMSNAFKFTPTGGIVELNISTEFNKNFKKGTQECVKIEVVDNGIGLKKSDIDKIFDRFYQVYSKETSFNTGTGIGLHLSLSLVHLHKGVMYAESRTDGPGSRFVVILPLGNEHLPQADLIIEENILPAPIHKVYASEIFDQIKTGSVKNTKPKTNYKIMIVEDEEEIRNYLNYELGSIYKIIACENGKIAYETLFDEKPDLIISDIMMPEMDGITLCKKVKGNIQTNHIPIILLTALSKDEDKAQGIDIGADLYLAKPFNTDFLKKFITNLLENRRKIFKKSQSSPDNYNYERIEIKSHDEILLQKVMTIIKNHIADENLNVELLAEGVGISRVHMHRKLKELTNQSARDFIKNIRMKQAAYMLTNKKLNISEVAYSVGYSNLSHFSNSFKAFYGVSPKEYIQKQHHILPENTDE